MNLSYEKNVLRRHMSPEDAEAAALKYHEELKKLSVKVMRDAGSLGAAHGKKGGRGRKKPPQTNLSEGVTAPKKAAPQSRDTASEMAGVSVGTFQSMKTVEAAGTPALKDMLSSKAVTPSAAAAVAKLPPAQQQEVVADGPKAVKEYASKPAPGGVVGPIPHARQTLYDAPGSTPTTAAGIGPHHCPIAPTRVLRRGELLWA